MADGAEIDHRLGAVDRRLGELAQAEQPAGLTDPDPDGTEQWEAAQVWAHMAEFVGFWRGQMEHVIESYGGDPVPFGRTKEDVGRISGIETGRHEPMSQLYGKVRESIADLRERLQALTNDEWKAVGRHVRGFDVDVAGLVNRFVIEHLEEHALQLEGLANSDS